MPDREIKHATLTKVPGPTVKMRIRRRLRWPSRDVLHRAVERALWIAVAGTLAVTAWQTFAYNDGRVDSVPPGQAALALCALLVAILVASGLRLRTQWLRLVLPSAAVLAVVAAVLGAAAYSACPSNVPGVGQLGWILQLFVGGVEEIAPGRECANSELPGFQAARTLALLATFVGAVGAGLIAARGPVDRLRAWASNDVDVVVGLDASSLELVGSLLAENRERPRREPWIDARPPWWHRGSFAAVAPSSEPTSPLVVDGSPQPRAAVRLREQLTGGRPYDRLRWMQRRPRVIVLAPDSSSGLVDVARDLGAIVLVGPPDDARQLRGLLTSRAWISRHRRVALRRMYVVSGISQVDRRVARAARQVLLPGYAPHRHGVVPRILVAFEDAWQGWAFRNSELTKHRWVLESAPAGARAPALLTVPSAPTGQPIVDGVTPLDLVSQQLVELLIAPSDSGTFQPGERGWRYSRVVLVGASSSWFTLVNEIQWQVWARFEVALEGLCAADRLVQDELRRLAGGSPTVEDAVASAMQSETGCCDSWDLAGMPSALREDLSEHHAEEWQAAAARWGDACHAALRSADHPEVVLHGPASGRHVEEWESLGAPWQSRRRTLQADPSIRVVSSDEDLHELMKGGRVAVIFLEGGVAERELASHLARTHGADLVAVYDPDSVGLSEPATLGAPYRFGPCWTRTMPGCPRRVPVGDSMTRIAQQQHLAYLGRWHVAPGDPWQTGRDDETGSGKLATNPWSRLPEFYREDNVRQIWHVLQWFVINGYEWRPLRREDPFGVPAEPAVYEGLARSEYRRWLEMRRRNGWRAPRDGEGRNDFRRVHPRMAGLDDLSFDEFLARQIVDRFWSIGLVAEPLAAAQRTGRVRGRQVERRTVWVAPGSGLTHVAEPGDWCIQSVTGGEARYVSQAVVEQLYRPVSQEGEHVWILGRERSTALAARARMAESREIVESPEGLVVAEPGDWIVMQRLSRDGIEGFDRWPLTEHQFEQGYMLGAGREQ